MRDDDPTPPTGSPMVSVTAVLLARVALYLRAVAEELAEGSRILDGLEPLEREQLLTDLAHRLAAIGDGCHEARRSLRDQAL